jgi:hypothetical protein
LQLPVSSNIYNQSRIINLTSPVYFIHGGKWIVVPDQEIDVNTVMKNHLEFDSGQDILEGTLVYRIQREYAESDKAVQDESKCVWFLIAWRIEYTKGLDVRVLLVEYNKEFNWDEDRLKQLHQKYWYSLNAWINTIESNWLLDDATILTTEIRVMNEVYGWNIFISEGTGDNAKRPLWINTER